MLFTQHRSSRTLFASVSLSLFLLSPAYALTDLEPSEHRKAIRDMSTN